MGKNKTKRTKAKGELSDDAKEVLAEVFKNDAAKKAVIDMAIVFVNKVIDNRKIAEYVKEVKKIIEIEKGDGSQIVEAIEIIGCIKNILVDLYSHLQEIKASALNKADRLFVKENIDIIAQVVIIKAIDELQERKLIDNETFVKILIIVKGLAALNIDMSITKKWFACCGKQN